MTVEDSAAMGGDVVTADDQPAETEERFIGVRDRPAPATVAIICGVGVVAVLLTSLAARDGGVDRVEESVLLWVNGWPDALEPAMWAVQQFGLLFAPIVVGAIVAVAGRRWTLIVPFALVLPLKLLIEKAVVKQLIERERPYISYGEDIVVRGGAFEGLSFPSGHTTTAFATGVLLLAVLPPKWRPAPILWAAMVGLARMYMGEHNLYDVVNGVALGTSFGILLWYFVLVNPAIAGHDIRRPPTDS